jgi:hypothetical protein
MLSATLPNARPEGDTAPNTDKERMMKTDDLRDKVVLTTGASSGIGAAIAREAAARGAISILVGRDASKLEEIEYSIRSQGGVRRRTSQILQTPLKSNCFDRTLWLMRGCRISLSTMLALAGGRIWTSAPTVKSTR